MADRDEQRSGGVQDSIKYLLPALLYLLHAVWANCRAEWNVFSAIIRRTAAGLPTV
jgi:hypothetical protein